MYSTKNYLITILENSREILSKETNWTQQGFSLDQDGEEVKPWDERAVQWCIVGALHRACGPILKKGPQLVTQVAAMKLLHDPYYEGSHQDLMNEVEANLETIELETLESIGQSNDEADSYEIIPNVINYAIACAKNLEE